MTLELVHRIETPLVVEPDLETLTLDQLAAEAQASSGLARKAGYELLLHGIRIGKILEEAANRMSAAELEEWTWKNVGIKRAHAYRLRRFAKHETELRRLSPTNLQEAELLMGAMSRQGRIAPEECERVQKMYADGMTWQQISQATGLSKTGIWRRLHRDSATEKERRNNRRTNKTKEEVRRARRDSAARKAGGTVATAYSRIRLAAQAVDYACAEATDSDVRAALTNALRNVYQAEDQIVRALGVE